MKIDGFSSSSSVASYNSPSILEDSSARKMEPSKSIEQQLELQHSEKKKDEQKKEITKDEAEHIVNGINEFLEPKYTNLSFKLHDKLDRFYVEVVDQETKKVIREIPDKELLDMYAKMTEFLGLFIDRKL